MRAEEVTGGGISSSTAYFLRNKQAQHLGLSPLIRDWRAKLLDDAQISFDDLLADAGARGALANVEINLEGLTDAAYVASMRAKAAALRKRLGSAPRATSA